MFIIHIIVNGLVQSVSFRYSVKEYAQKNKITGTVQNLSSTNKVEIFAQAPEDKIKKFINWLKNNPGLSQVEDIQILKQEKTNQIYYYGFRIL